MSADAVPAVASQLTFKKYQGLAGLSDLRSAWLALLQTMPEPRFNHFPEWYSAYLSRSVPDGHRVWFVAAHRGGKLAAIFPLELQNYRVGRLRPRILGTVEDDQMQLSDFVFAPTPENDTLLDELIRWLRSQHLPRWDEMRLRKVSEESSIAYAARARLPKATVVLRHDGSAFFRTDGTYEQATPAINSKFKSNLRRRNRIAEQSAPLTHRTYRQGAELSEAFEVFLDIEASGWKGEVGTSSAIRCDLALLVFYRSLLLEFGARDACVISLLRHGEQAVAGQFCLQIGRTLNILKVGFSEAHANFAPGVLLLERMIQQACDDPEIDVLHLVNEPDWAKSFKPSSRGVWSYCAPNWTARGMLVHAGLLAKRIWEGRGTASKARSASEQKGAESAIRSEPTARRTRAPDVCDSPN